MTNFIAHDSDYFRRRAAESRAAACDKQSSHNAEVAGELALAFAALARRHSAATATTAAAAPFVAEDA